MSSSDAAGRNAALETGVIFVLPGQLRELVGGRSVLTVGGGCASVGEAFGRLRQEHAAVYDRVFTERGEVRPHVNVFVDGADIRWAGGLDAPVRERSEVMILPAVSGG